MSCNIYAYLDGEVGTEVVGSSAVVGSERKSGADQDRIRINYNELVLNIFCL